MFLSFILLLFFTIKAQAFMKSSEKLRESFIMKIQQSYSLDLVFLFFYAFPAIFMPFRENKSSAVAGNVSPRQSITKQIVIKEIL